MIEASGRVPVAYIAHGFNSKDHGRWIRDLGSRLEAVGFAVVPVWYGWKHLLRIDRQTATEAKRLAAIADGNAVGIGHSNGCALLLEAVENGAHIEHLIFVNPALPPDAHFPPSVVRVDVFYAPNDSAVVAGKFWAKYNPLRIFGWSSPWGVMGRTGYQGPADTRIHNWSLGEVGHSGALRWDRLVKLSDAIARLASSKEEPEGPSLFD